MDTEPETGATNSADPSATSVAVAEEHHSAVTPMRASVAMMIVGALVLFVGMLSTTAATGQPSCPPGTDLIAKFEFKGGKYVFEKPAGNEQVVTIYQANAKSGKWKSTIPVSDIIVKGGPGSKLTNLKPPQTSGTFSNAGLKVGQGQTPDISNIQFCGPKPQPTTTTTEKPTTTEATTTTTEPTTTTTESTTTTEATTTTTEPTTTTTESTTTTEATTTTTEPTTTTTEATTTTTEADGTTTTEATTTTTEADGTTTTEADGTTTTEAGPDVQGRVEVATRVTPDDAAVAAGALALTGGSSVPLIVIGIVLLLGGATLALVTRSRQRQAEA